jgi:hypothetical protein
MHSTSLRVLALAIFALAGLASAASIGVRDGPVEDGRGGYNRRFSGTTLALCHLCFDMTHSELEDTSKWEGPVEDGRSGYNRRADGAVFGLGRSHSALKTLTAGIPM